MEDNIIEGNKIIAEFIGGYIEIGRQTKKPMYSFLNNIDFCEALLPQTKDGNYLFFENELKFHSSWDWLMPACIKFMGIKNLKESLLNKYDYWCKKIDDAVCTYDIQFACKTLVNAINWYNKEQNAAVSDTTEG